MLKNLKDFLYTLMKTRKKKRGLCWVAFLLTTVKYPNAKVSYVLHNRKKIVRSFFFSFILFVIESRMFLSRKWLRISKEI